MRTWIQTLSAHLIGRHDHARTCNPKHVGGGEIGGFLGLLAASLVFASVRETLYQRSKMLSQGVYTHQSMCVCHTDTCTQTLTHTCMYTHRHTPVHTHRHICTHIAPHLCTHTQRYTCTQDTPDTHTHTHLCTHRDTCTHTDRQMYTHTHPDWHSQNSILNDWGRVFLNLFSI